MKDTVEVFFHSQQPYTHLNEEDIAQYAERIIQLQDGEIVGDERVANRVIAQANVNGADAAS